MVFMCNRNETCPPSANPYINRVTSPLLALLHTRAGASNCATMKRNYDDLTGQKFGKLKVISKFGVDSGHRTLLNCICDCGVSKVVGRYNLRSGHSKSCGCNKAISTRLCKTTHGNARPGKITTEYRTWLSMIQRCTNPKRDNYKYYGALGVKVCSRWSKSFASFLSDMGKKPSQKYSIDRKNPFGNYTASNCRWATQTEQVLNIRKSIIKTAKGKL